MQKRRTVANADPFRQGLGSFCRRQGANTVCITPPPSCSRRLRLYPLLRLCSRLPHCLSGTVRLFVLLVFLSKFALARSKWSSSSSISFTSHNPYICYSTYIGSILFHTSQCGMLFPVCATNLQQESSTVSKLTPWKGRCDLSTVSRCHLSFHHSSDS